MKFTKFIPLAALVLAFTAVPTFAATQGTGEATNTYSINVPDYFNVTQVSATTSSGAVTVGTDMATLTWDDTMGVTYKVVNNVPDKKFYLKATCPATGTPKAFGAALSDAGANTQATVKLAFANTLSGQTAGAAAVTSALSADPNPAENANVIAVLFTCAPATITNGTIDSRTMTSQEIVYQIDQGTYQFPYTMGTEAEAGTFSSHDAKGTYQATITITDTAS